MNLNKPTNLLIEKTLRDLGCANASNMSLDRKIEAICKMSAIKIATLSKDRDAAIQVANTNNRSSSGIPETPAWDLGTR